MAQWHHLWKRRFQPQLTPPRYFIYTHLSAPGSCVQPGSGREGHLPSPPCQPLLGNLVSNRLPTRSMLPTDDAGRVACPNPTTNPRAELATTGRNPTQVRLWQHTAGPTSLLGGATGGPQPPPTAAHCSRPPYLWPAPARPALPLHSTTTLLPCDSQHPARSSPPLAW